MQPINERAATDASVITIRGGSIYLDTQIYERYFHGLESVILQRRDNDLLILPVRHSAAGGYLLKIRNSAGDRVVNAMDFLRNCGLASEETISAPVFWNREYSALFVANIFNIAN